MRIAACDDNLEFLQGLSELLNKYGEENHCNVEYKVFTNPLELVAQMHAGNEWYPMCKRYPDV